MSLYDAISGALLELQAEAESRMTLTLEFRRSLGFAYDPAVGKEVESFQVLLTTKGRVKSAGASRVTQTEAGAREVTVTTRELHIPIASPTVPPGADAFVTAVGPSDDPTLLDARLRIGAQAPGSQTTARRLTIKEVLT